MGFLQSYSSFLVRHPGKVLIIGTFVVFSLFVGTLIIRTQPSFKDPLVGFEARDTPLANRINTWRLLVDETSALANNLSLSINSLKYESVNHQPFPTNQQDSDPNHQEFSNKVLEIPIAEESTQQVGKNNSVSTTIDESEEDEYYKFNNFTSTNSLPNLMHYSLISPQAFCGKLYEGYAQVVIGPSIRNSNAGLFNLNSMLSICQLDQKLRLEQSLEDSVIFQNDCERFQTSGIQNQSETTTCCNSWSLPNYVACLNNRTSCMDLTAFDLKNVEHLLTTCAPYYFKSPYEECFNPSPKGRDTSSSSVVHSLNILASTAQGLNHWSKAYCGSIPEICLRCDGWIYTVMNYLVNDNFIQAQQTNMTIARSNPKNDKRRANNQNKDSIVNKLTYTNIFLPMAKSASLMRYYSTLTRHNLKTPFAQVKAMDLGLKNSLFEHLISADIKLFIVALLLILMVIAIYTCSIILSLVILMIICLSLCLSYAIYELVFNIPIFPFMNLLAVVISFGICSDNAMLFCKHWIGGRTSSPIETLNTNSQIKSNEQNKEQSNLDRMLRRAVVSTFIATLATACSFIISAISKVIAVRCFCIFATLSVITNYLLIVLLLPPALILDSRFAQHIITYFDAAKPEVGRLFIKAQYYREKLVRNTFNTNWIFILVTRYKLYLIITFIALLSCASILVFYKPTMQPADEDDIQLLSRKHAFEQYDRNLRKQFAFERYKLGDTLPALANQFYDTPDTLPIRVVFGVKPTDNGNHFDPHDRGTILFDSKFDLSEPRVQIWLLDFCRKLRQQRFIYPSAVPDLSNCFMETFKSWMETRSCSDPISPEIDRSPCCQSYEFPYDKYILDRCIGEALNVIRKTPQLHQNINAGVRFFKNSTRVAAIIIEYQSNLFFSQSYTKMEKFFTDIDDWVTWQINNTAPPGLKSGWFVSSDLELLALQTELESGTTASILLEVAFAVMALMVGTRDAVLTIAGTLTIGTIIITTVAALIILKWTLGVVESILISLTIGLSIDFALHYTVAYREGKKAGTSNGIIQGILDEVGSPIALATITTSMAGFVIVWSDIMAYQELGVFLMLIALFSWLTSTLFLLPMLATIGSIVEHGELHVRLILRQALKMLIDRL